MGFRKIDHPKNEKRPISHQQSADTLALKYKKQKLIAVLLDREINVDSHNVEYHYMTQQFKGLNENSAINYSPSCH